MGAYVRRVRGGPCFICALVAGEPKALHEIVFEDDSHIAFLNRYPTLVGYTLVAPKRHIEDPIGGSPRTNTWLSRRWFGGWGWVCKRCCRSTGYVLSLESRQGNAHVHWHVAPLPPGVPYEEQQFHELMAENGVIDQTQEAKSELAHRLRSRIRRLPTT